MSADDSHSGRGAAAIAAELEAAVEEADARPRGSPDRSERRLGDLQDAIADLAHARAHGAQRVKLPGRGRVTFGVREAKRRVLLAALACIEARQRGNAPQGDLYVAAHRLAEDHGYDAAPSDEARRNRVRRAREG